MDEQIKDLCRAYSDERLALAYNVKEWSETHTSRDSDGNSTTHTNYYVNRKLLITPLVAGAAELLRGLRGTNTMALTVVYIIVAMLGGAWGWLKIAPQLRARQQVEKILRVLFMLCALVAIMTTVGIVMSVLFESIRFFGQVSPVDFLFGTQWSPQTALRADQVASEGAFGAIPLFMGTLLISAIALLVAVPSEPNIISTSSCSTSLRVCSTVFGGV